MENLINKIFKHKRKIIIILVITCIFRIIQSVYTYEFKYKNEEESTKKEAVIISLEENSEDKISYLVRYDKNNFLLNIYLNDKYGGSKENKENKECKENEESINEIYSDFKYGDKVTFRGKLTIPTLKNNPYEFNYKRYLNSNNICGIITTSSIKKVGEKYGNYIIRFANYIKEKVYLKLKEILPIKEQGLYKSMVFSDDMDLDDTLKQSLQNIGLSHIISVSGANISYIILLVMVVFKDINKKNSFFIISVILLYLFMCGIKASLFRACVMSIIGIISNLANIKLKKYTKVIVSVLILVIYNPYIIFNIGAILSYVSILGILIYNNEVASFLDVRLKQILKLPYVFSSTSKLKQILYTLLSKICNILSFSISIQILAFPITIYYFGKFSLNLFLSNLLIYPLLLIHGIVGFSSIFCIFIPYIVDLLYNAEYFILHLTITLIELLDRIDILDIQVPKLSIIYIFVYYVILFLFRFRKKFILYFKKSHARILKNIIYPIFVLYIIIVILNIVYIKYFENYIYFFNVGQGNMALIRYNQKTILVDIGSTVEKTASNILLNFLKAKCISKIDMCFLTHMHEDHINGIYELCESIKVENIVYSVPKEVSEEYTKLKEFIDKLEISTIQTDIFDTFSFDKVKIYILSPPSNVCINASDIANANSQIILVSIDNNNYLFMGDATCESEKYLISKLENMKDTKLKTEIELKLKNLQVFQVGHHGSDSSSSVEFLDYIKVKEGVISASKKVYGHPSEEVVKRLEQYNIKIKLTEKTGAIKYKLN